MMKFTAICTILLGLCFVYTGKHDHYSKTVASKDLGFFPNNSVVAYQPLLRQHKLRTIRPHVCICTLLTVTNEYLMNEIEYVFCIEQ
jgi:hypothetical protein